MASFLVLQRRLRNLTIKEISLVLIVAVVVFNECLIYAFQSLRWTNIPKKRDIREEMVVLFVADPQLIGIQDEPRFPIGTITRLDADRYLQKTFSWAFSHTQPDVVVFLGDLLDEGSKAKESEYQSYKHRFNTIFSQIDSTKFVIIPGDNDIGGEPPDFRSPFKMNRFEKNFENMTGAFSHGFLDFLKLDIRGVFSENMFEKRKLISNLAPQLKNPVRIVINHEGLLAKRNPEIFNILKVVQPHVLFTGHWHVSRTVKCETCLSDDDGSHSQLGIDKLNDMQDFHHIDLTELLALNEIMVPTCSYRMGEPNMGYGVAIIDKSQLRYTVLWLPARYKVLGSYVVTLIVVIILLMVSFITTPRSRL